MSNTLPIIAEIENIRTTKGLDYIESIVYLAEKMNIEIEVIAQFVKKDRMMKEKIQFEGENLNVLRKSARLPI